MMKIPQGDRVPKEIEDFVDECWQFYKNCMPGANSDTPRRETLAIILFLHKRLLGATVSQKVVEPAKVVEPEQTALLVDRKQWSGRGRKPNWMKEQEAGA